MKLREVKPSELKNPNLACRSLDRICGERIVEVSMADLITKAQYKELEDSNMFGDTAEFHRLLEKYAGIVARPYTAYSYYCAAGNYIGDSNENDLDDLLQAAFVEVRDG